MSTPLERWVTAVFGLLGCAPQPEVVRPEDLRQTTPGATALVAVYSFTGRTAKVGRAFAAALGADYQRLLGSGEEGGTFFTTPAWTSEVKVKPATLDLSAYRLVLVGGPLWYWRPNAVSGSFLRASDLRGKRVVLFYTFEGGGMSTETLATWKKWATDRGGEVVDVVGLDRKQLTDDAALTAEAERLARERLARWRGD